MLNVEIRLELSSDMMWYRYMFSSFYPERTLSPQIALKENVWFFSSYFPGLGFSPSSAVSLLSCRVILLFISMAKPVSTLLWMAKRTGFFFFPSSVSERHEERGRRAETHCPLSIQRVWQCYGTVWKSDERYNDILPRYTALWNLLYHGSNVSTLLVLSSSP